MPPIFKNKPKAKKLNRDEKYRIILNNPILFIETFMKVRNKKGKLVPFKLNKMQKDYVKNIHSSNIILKARQGGMTTVNCALSLYYATTRRGCHNVMLSHSEESTRSVFNKLKALYNTIPDSIRQPTTRNSRQELAFTNDSCISCQTMGNKEVLRGSTVFMCHISEYAFVKDEQAKDHLVSMQQAMRPDGIITIETTANGMNFFHEFYLKSKEGKNTFKIFFYNYIDTADMFLDDFEKDKNIFKNNYGYEFNEDELTEEEQELYKIDGMTLDILCWRRLKIEVIGIDKFNQEFPLTDHLSFITSGSSVFCNELIAENELAILSQKITHISKSRIKDSLPKSLLKYYGKSLFVYKVPEQSKRYIGGCDGSEGLGQDFSVIEIVDTDGQQVAEWYSNTIKPYEVTDILHELALWYNNAFLVIEKKSAGIIILPRMRKEKGYFNLYRHRDPNKLKQNSSYGFDTNKKTKEELVSNFIELWEKKQITIYSRRLLGEMKIYTNKDGKYSGKGGCDDSVISFGLCCIGLLNRRVFKRYD